MLTPILALTVLGGLLGLALAYAARRYHVPVDPRVEEINAELPGANCGGCGFAGCAAFAEAVASGSAAPTLCGAGGTALAARIGQVMGIDTTVNEEERLVATCHCAKQGVAIQEEYRGVASCRAAHLPGLSGGPTACRYGCLGFGDCIAACPFGALSAGGDGEPIVVDTDKCTGCRRCEKACPRNLFAVAAKKRTIAVACHNRDKGPQAYQICAHACIACRKCEKACPADAIHVPNNLAEIDYAKCILCGECVKACPRDTIIDLRLRRAHHAAPPSQAAYNRE